MGNNDFAVRKVLLRIISVIFYIMIMMMLAGCATRLVDFTVISTKNIEWNRADEFERADERSQGEDVAHLIIFIPTSAVSVEAAVDRAIETVPGAVALVDGVVRRRFWWIPYVYGQDAIIVEGTPLIDPQLASNWDDPYLVSHINPDGTVRETVAVPREEYVRIRQDYLEPR